MTRVVHISDLHFGKDDERLADPLLSAIIRARPDVIAVSGDLTQRARGSQFRAARAFLDALPAPWICVPGNHDLPLYNLPVRLAAPYYGYRRHITDDLAPYLDLEGLAIKGLNTAWPFAWQRGRLRRRQLDRACKLFEGFDGARLVLAHHPFQQSPESHKQLMPGAQDALERLAECGTDIILTGHLHLWRAAPFVAKKGRNILQVHVGTGLSTRLRGQENDFAILDIEDQHCTLTRMVASPTHSFEPEACERFELGDV